MILNKIAERGGVTNLKLQMSITKFKNDIGYSLVQGEEEQQDLEGRYAAAQHQSDSEEFKDPGETGKRAKSREASLKKQFRDTIQEGGGNAFQAPPEYLMAQSITPRVEANSP